METVLPYKYLPSVFPKCFFPNLISAFLESSLRDSTKRQLPGHTGRKLNVHKTFRGRPGRLLNAYVRSVYVLRPERINIEIIKKMIIHETRRKVTKHGSRKK